MSASVSKSVIEGWYIWNISDCIFFHIWKSVDIFILVLEHMFCYSLLFTIIYPTMVRKA